MNILIVSAGIPRPASGADTRNYHLLKALASRHAVSLLALVDDAGEQAQHVQAVQKELARPIQLVRVPSQAKRVRQTLDLLRGRSYFLNRFILPAVQDKLDVLLAGDDYDVVLFESVVLADYRVPAGVKVVIDQHNIEYELLQRTFSYERARVRKWYSWLEGRLLQTGEIARCREADAVLVTSAREHLLLKKLLPQQMIKTVPNGVDLAAFQPMQRGEIANRIVFTGTMDYYPNIDAVLTFARHCWPLIQARVPGITWHIVGRNPPLEVRSLSLLPGITVTGSVPDVRHYLASAAVTIAPLQIGSGTRLKILEAFAMRKAVVSTSVGCEGIAITPGTHLMLADQPDAFAHAVVELLRDPARRVSLAHAGRSLVEDSYSWEQSGAALLEALDALS